MIKVVIESPLGGGFALNRRYAIWCAWHCYTRGEAAYASHLIFPFFLDDQNAEQREFGITAGYEWAKHADIFAFYIDLGMSPGMTRAKERWGIEENRTKRRATVRLRNLPVEMLEAFNKGEVPDHTKGFHL